MKIVKTGAEARTALIAGADKLANAVKLTLGPSGFNAVLGPKGGALSRITNDGVTIAREMECEDEIENLGLKTMLETCSLTNELAGDGTTTAITLGQAVLKALVPLFGSGQIIGNRMSVSEVRTKVSSELETITTALKTMAKPVASKEELIAVAKIAVEDDALAELIGSTQWDLGPQGTILPEISNDKEDSMERVNGIRIDNGFGSSLAINNIEKQTLELQDIAVILTNHTMQSLNSVIDIVEQLLKRKQKNVVLVARGFTQEAIMACQENAKKGVINIIPINAPYTDQNEVMLDLAASLGGSYINSEERQLEDMQLSDVGHAESIVAGRWNAVFTQKKDEESDTRIARRVAELDQQLAGTLSVFERKMVEDRKAQLTNGFAIMRVTGSTLSERNYKKDKVDDCANAVKAALQEGTVPGGGLALRTIGEGMPEDSLLAAAISAPYGQIQDNSGGLEIDPDLVRDPVKVTRIALEKAVSVATQLATAGVAIADKRKREKGDDCA